MRNKLDQYDTPMWAVDAILPHVITCETRNVLDPCAGTGVILDASKEYAPHIITQGMEIDPDRADVCSKKHYCSALDSLKCGWDKDFEVITNPPYMLAEEFCEHILKYSKKATVLLRLSFMASQKRKTFWDRHGADVYVIPKRPSFTGKGTDACDYAWFVFYPFANNYWQRLDI